MDFRFHNCWDNHQGIMKRVIFWAVVVLGLILATTRQVQNNKWDLERVQISTLLKHNLLHLNTFLEEQKKQYWDYKYTLGQWQKDKSQRRICCSREYSSAGAACAIAMPATAPSCRQLGQAVPGQPSWWGVPQTCCAEFVSQSQNNWATTFYLNLLLVTANDLKASLHLWDCFKCTDTNLAIKYS